VSDRAHPFAEHMPIVARALFGEPNRLQSKQGAPRWGRKGSLAIDEAQGVWFDHENETGGGVLDLIKREKGFSGREAIDWMCSIGCRIDDPASVNGAKLNGSKRAPSHPTGKKELAEIYDYRDENGVLVFHVGRFVFRQANRRLVLNRNGKPEKTFYQRRPDPAEPDVWIWGLAAGEYMRRGPGHDWYRFDEARWAKLPASRQRKTVAGVDKTVVYRLTDVLEAASFGRSVFIVEGEQKADTLARWNLCATCNAEGAGKWTVEHAAHLRGTDVVILPDNDDRGRTHADAVARTLQGIAARVRLLNLPGLPQKGDVVDWIQAGGTREQFDQLIDHAPDWQPAHHTGSNGATTQDAALESAPASSFTIRGVSWLWKNRFALGKLGLIGGLPDRGKGLISAGMIATVTTGGIWPCEEGTCPKGSVLLLTAEDDPNDTVVPRLIAAGADRDRVHIVGMVHSGEAKRSFSLMTDLAMLKAKLEEIGNVSLVIIDPVSAYLGVGKINNYSTTDVRGMLMPLQNLAAETMTAIVGVMHFNKKADVTNAMLRIADSLAYVAAARHVYVVVDDPENERRLFVKAKNNLAPDTKALSYSVTTKIVGHDKETGDIWAPYILWGTEHVNVSATEAMQAEAGGGNSRSSATEAKDGAKEFLLEILASGSVRKREIDEAARANGIAERTLFRAKAELGIVAKKGGLKEGWMWQLPEPDSRSHDHDRD
jgi:putative DNA primase/helicase